jgi:hypothetical protein
MSFFGCFPLDGQRAPILNTLNSRLALDWKTDTSVLFNVFVENGLFARSQDMIVIFPTSLFLNIQHFSILECLRSSEPHMLARTAGPCS